MKKLIIFGTGQVADIISHYFKNDSNIKIFGFCEDEKYINKVRSNIWKRNDWEHKVCNITASFYETVIRES